ncbi:MAG: hypothetical protein JNM76_06840 [Betaproteobacteria bacterium]|nr:hypothetical protein [Betaproteobacteria bacterium]
MRPRRWRFAALALAAALIAAATGAFATHVTPPFERAEFLGSPADFVPGGPMGRGTDVTLPDVWSQARRTAYREGWYRIRFELVSTPVAGQALYVPRASRNAAFYVNGVFVGSGGPIENPHYRNWNRAHFFAVSETVLKPGENVIDIRLVTSAVGKDGLSRVFFGADTDLRPEFDLRRFHQLTFPWIQNGINAFLIVFLTLYWILRPDRAEHLFFALALLCWSARNMLYLQWHAPPMDDATLDLLQMQLFNGVFALLALFSVRYIEARSRWVDAAAVALLTVPLLLEWLLPASAQGWVRFFTYQFANLMGVGVCVLLGLHAWRGRRPEHVLLFLAATAMVVIGARDVLAVQNKLGFEAIYLLQYAALPLFLTMGWALLKRLLDSVKEAELLNRSLEARVEEKHRELEHNYNRINDIERQSAVAGERARMMQDMHDGLGSQLMTTLALVENRSLNQQEVAEALRGCIDDMRLTIDSLQPDDNDLASLLGNLRYRLEPRLKAAGIDLEWKVGELSPLVGAGPHALLQVMRIVQEAFTNVLKHSGATRVRVETRETPAEARLIVADNGKRGDRSQPVSVAPDAATALRRGRGLSNMQARAQALGARIERGQHDEGHTVSLVFNLLARKQVARAGEGK